MRFCLRTVVLMTAVSLLTGTVAHAQAWLGQFAGEMAAQRRAAELEEACMHGAPADPEDVERAQARIEKAMTAYFALTSQSSARDLRDVFAFDKPGVTWRDATGPVLVPQLGTRLDAPVPERTIVNFVVGGDAQTARVVWQGSDSIYYAGDFVNEGWLGGWKIWHLALLPTRPDVPAAYCHFDPAQGF